MRWNGAIVGEPGVVAASMKTDIAERGSGFGARFKGTPDQRLIDVAKCGVVFTEQGKDFGIVPRRVTHFDGQRVVRKTMQQLYQVHGAFSRAMKGEREL